MTEISCVSINRLLLCKFHFFKDGGMKAGTFDAYPSHSADPFRAKPAGARNPSAVNKSGKTYVPPPGPKSAPTTSILDQNIVRCLSSFVVTVN